MCHFYNPNILPLPVPHLALLVLLGRFLRSGGRDLRGGLRGETFRLGGAADGQSCLLDLADGDQHTSCRGVIYIYIMYLVIHLLIYSFIHEFIYSCIDLFIYLLIYLFIHSTCY